MNPRQLCVNCGKSFLEHTNDKCLFEATTFRPRATTHGIVINPAYQRFHANQVGTSSAMWDNPTATTFCPPNPRALEWACTWCGKRCFEPMYDSLHIGAKLMTVVCDACKRPSAIR